MNYLTTGRILALLAIVFVAGGAAGAVVTLKSAHHQEVQPSTVEKVCTRFQDRLKARLNLSDEQLRKLQPVFDQTAEQLQSTRTKAIQEIDQIICRAHERIAPELTAVQKEKLTQMDQERREAIHRRLEGLTLVKDH